MSPLEIEIVEDPARAASAVMLGAASGGGHIVLTGGSTPKRAYEQFVSAVTTVGVDLRESTFWFGDERCVAPDDDRSNFRMATESLFTRLRADNRPTVRRMKGELGFDEGAADYERQLDEAGAPEFDLLLLGLGPDAHTASMFPGQPTLEERARLVVGVPEAGFEPYVPRITMTLPAIARARKVVFLVSGDSKADAVARAFISEASPDPSVPASMVREFVDDVTVLLDPAAAARL